MSGTEDRSAAAPAQPPPVGAPQAASLAELEARLAYELACLQLPAARWTPQRTHAGQPVVDVAVIGGGMAGLALGAALQHRGVTTEIVDESPEGCEGPWATTARMETLRSPKQLAGPALGLPSLTFRAWFEAQSGAAAWEALDKIPRLQWMDYLRWYRRVLGIEVRNEHRVTDIWPRADGLVELRIEHPGASRSAFARRVVLATGRAGLGGGWVPEWVQALPRERWAHSADLLDPATLRGLRVGVVGAGASAMDSAATALEAGAARVHLLVRRGDIPRINKGKGAGNPGFVSGFGRLDDAWKWRYRHYINVQQVPPPRNSTQRVARHANAFFHLGCAVRGAQLQGGALRVDTSLGPIELDFLIFATGFAIDWRMRPMLRHIEPHVRRWGDRFSPAPGDEDAELEASPDLGRDFEFLPRQAAQGAAGSSGSAGSAGSGSQESACPGVSRIHCFCYPAALSQGVITGDIPAISEGALQLASSLAGLLYVEDVQTHFARMQAYAEPEVFGDEWVASPLPGAGPTGRS